MKKVVAFMMAFLYLGLTTGLAVNIQYCMGKVADVRVNNLDDTNCSCNSKTKMPCCKHNYHLLKVNDEHQQVAIAFNPQLFQPVLNTFFDFITKLSLPVLKQEFDPSKTPPLLSRDTYIENCVFRI